MLNQKVSHNASVWNSQTDSVNDSIQEFDSEFLVMLLSYTIYSVLYEKNQIQPFIAAESS